MKSEIKTIKPCEIGQQYLHFNENAPDFNSLKIIDSWEVSDKNDKIFYVVKCKTKLSAYFKANYFSNLSNSMFDFHSVLRIDRYGFFGLAVSLVFVPK